MAALNLGMVTAYAYAVQGGYTGTEADFTALLGNIAEDLAEIENLTVTATTLPAGSSATASYSDGVLSLGIPKGDKGDQGDQGETGPTGATPQLSIGTVTTGVAGSDAAVSITGTDEEPVLNFTIPRGPSGDEELLATLYSSSKTYAVGDYCIYNDVLYKCTTAITTAEAWTAAHWTAVTVGDELTGLKADLSIISDRNKNLLPIGTKSTEVKGVTIHYDSGVFTFSGTPTGTVYTGRLIYLTKAFFLDTGSYVAGQSDDSSSDNIQWFIQKVSDDSIVATGNAAAPNNRTFTLSEPTKVYVGFNITGGHTYTNCTTKLQIEKGTASSKFVKSDMVALDSTARAEISSFETFADLSIINRFDKNSADNLDGKYMPNANIYDSETYTVSHYIDLIGLNKIETSYIHMFSWFDENKSYLSHDNVSGYDSWDIPLTVPSGARYVRCSFKTEYKNVVQIGSHVTRNDYVPYGYYRTPKQKEIGTKTVVDVNGGGDYASLLEAMISTTNDVVVRYGDYDLVAEYKAYFGDDYFTNPSTYASAAGNFAHGLWISERTVTFDAGSRVLYDLTGIDVSYAEGSDRRFSAIVVGHNARIIGLNCVGTNNWYVVHDDDGVKDYNYTNEFIDCHIVGDGLVNENVIGAGCQTRSKTVIDGCYLDNGVSDANTKTIRYHNTPYDGKPQIIVKNTFVNGKMFFQYYGTQTTKGRVMVNNCSMASAIDVSALSEGQSENFELFAWSNEIRS